MIQRTDCPLNFTKKLFFQNSSNKKNTLIKIFYNYAVIFGTNIELPSENLTWRRRISQTTFCPLSFVPSRILKFPEDEAKTDDQDLSKTKRLPATRFPV